MNNHSDLVQIVGYGADYNLIYDLVYDLMLEYYFWGGFLFF